MKKIQLSALIFSLCFSMVSCMSLEEKKKKAEEEGNALVSIKSKLVKGAGDALKSDGKEAAESATEGVGELIKGLNNGFDKSLNQAKVEGDSNFLTTFELGRTEKFFSEEKSKSDSVNTKKIVVYLVANEAYNGKVRLKAFDQDNNEIGRSTVEVNMAEDDAQYFDFKFDKRTPILQADHFIIDKK